MELDHGAEVLAERGIEAGDELRLLIEQVPYNSSIIGNCDRSSSNIPSNELSIIYTPVLWGSTYWASWLLANSGASIEATSGKVYEFLPVVTITGMRLNLSKAMVLKLLTVLTSVTVIVIPASAE